MLSTMNYDTMNDYEKASCQIRNLLSSFEAGQIKIGELADYIMDNLSEKAIKGLADDYDDSKDGEPLS